MSSHLIFVFVSAASAELQQATVETVQRFTRNFYEGVRLLGNVGRQEPLLADVERAQVFVGVLDEATETGVAAAEWRHARAQGLTCFVYAPATTDLPTNLTTDLRDWLYTEHLPPVLGKIHREQMPRDEATTLVSAIKSPDDLGVWKKRLEEQGYRFTPAVKEETGLRWRLRQFSMRAFAFMKRWLLSLLGLLAILLLLVVAITKPWETNRSLVATASPTATTTPTPGTTPVIPPSPVGTASSTPISTASPISSPSSPLPSPRISPSPSPRVSPSPAPTTPSSPSPRRSPSPTPTQTPSPIPTRTQTPTPTPQIPVRVDIEPANLRFSSFGAKQLKFTNSRFEQIVITDVRFVRNSGHFAIAKPCRTPVLQRGASCEIIIRYFNVPTTDQEPQALLEITYNDGSKQRISTGATR